VSCTRPVEESEAENVAELLQRPNPTGQAEHGVDAVRGLRDRGRVEQVQLVPGRREQLVPGDRRERTERPAEDPGPPGGSEPRRLHEARPAPPEGGSPTMRLPARRDGGAAAPADSQSIVAVLELTADSPGGVFGNAGMHDRGQHHLPDDRHRRQGLAIVPDDSATVTLSCSVAPSCDLKTTPSVGSGPLMSTVTVR
jgi:hypothetical protein